MDSYYTYNIFFPFQKLFLQEHIYFLAHVLDFINQVVSVF